MLSKQKCVYVGPAGETFPTFKDQATWYLNQYFPGWNDFEKPKIYMIPPTFSYKDKRISQRRIKQLRKEQAERRRVAETAGAKPKNDKDAIRDNEILLRFDSDEAEHKVFEAIDKLRDTGVLQTPFIALHSWDISRLTRKDIEKIFPRLNFENEDNDCFKEYDFILVGPKIGIVSIEVKSPDFEKENAFPNQSLRLPKAFEEGLDQLKRAERLPYFLQKCTGYPVGDDNIPVTKILCTPNLETQKYKTWLRSLSTSDQAELEKTLDGTHLLFKPKDKNQLYLKLKEILEKSCRPISEETYKTYGPVIAAMGSITVTGEKNITVKSSIDNSSESKAISAADKEVKYWLRATILTPDQKEAIKCSFSRQFIVGTAGTGKTILLQEKASQLLQQGEHVTVLVPRSCVGEYEAFFKNNTPDRFTILTWTKQRFQTVEKIQAVFSNMVKEFGKEAINSPLFMRLFVEQLIREHYDEMFNDYDWLLACDGPVSTTHAIVDDALDVAGAHTLVLGAAFSLYYVIAMMLAEMLCPQKVVWVALDPYTKGKTADSVGLLMNAVVNDWNWRSLFESYEQEISSSESYSQIFHEINKREPDFMEKARDSYYCVKTLNQTMRCTKVVFDSYYNEDDNMQNFPQMLRPELGHNSQGIICEDKSAHFTLASEAQSALLKRVREQIGHRRGEDLNDIAVLVVGTSYMGENITRFFYRLLEIQEDLTVQSWHDISSLEWPIVVCCSCLPKKLDPSRNVQEIVYDRYRVKSRATTKLIIIEMTYDEDDIELNEKRKIEFKSRPTAGVMEHMMVTIKEFDPEKDNINAFVISFERDAYRQNATSIECLSVLCTKLSRAPLFERAVRDLIQKAWNNVKAKLCLLEDIIQEKCSASVTSSQCGFDAAKDSYMTDDGAENAKQSESADRLINHLDTIENAIQDFISKTDIVTYLNQFELQADKCNATAMERLFVLHRKLSHDPILQETINVTVQDTWNNVKSKLRSLEDIVLGKSAILSVTSSDDPDEKYATRGKNEEQSNKKTEGEAMKDASDEDAVQRALWESMNSKLPQSIRDTNPTNNEKLPSEQEMKIRVLVAEEAKLMAEKLKFEAERRYYEKKTSAIGVNNSMPAVSALVNPKQNQAQEKDSDNAHAVDKDF